MENSTRIIVIGASAGGVGALLRIAARLPPDLPAPILFVQHIGAHQSQLPKLLSAKGPLRAVFAQTGVEPEPGAIYVAPPDRHLLLEAGVMRLSRGPKEHHARPAIDPLFRSAALDCGPRAVGVILTGMLDDGTAGLNAIKACGGTAVVQDPGDAVAPSMPLSAVTNVPVDHVARLDELPELLGALARPLEEVAQVSAPEWLRIEHAITLAGAQMQDLGAIGKLSGFTCPDCGGALFELTQGSPLRFICHTGHAFSLQSLGWTQDQVTDEALWTALRALQEKEAVLRRLSDARAADDPASASAILTEAAKLADFATEMRAMVGSAPIGSFHGVPSREEPLVDS